MSKELIDAISSVDSFYKNCFLLFEDIVSMVREKTFKDNIVNIDYEGSYGVWNQNISASYRTYLFKHNDKFRFVGMFIKTHEDKLKSNSSSFKLICHELDIDPIYPLIIVFGIFKPRDIKRFTEQLNVRRNWIENTLLLNVPENIVTSFTRSKPYEFEELLNIETVADTDSCYCEKAIIKIRKLVDVKDSNEVEKLVDELLSFESQS
jgi:hypothetical protein